MFSTNVFNREVQQKLPVTCTLVLWKAFSRAPRLPSLLTSGNIQRITSAYLPEQTA